MSSQYEYRVLVVYKGVPDLQNVGCLFGTFTTREAAEQCLLVLAGRDDVRTATIERIVIS